MTDVLIRGVPSDVVAGVDARAERMGLSRSEFLRREMARMARTSDEPVTADALREFADAVADLADEDVMGQAWR
jgi:hypothetical protein